VFAGALVIDPTAGTGGGVTQIVVSIVVTVGVIVAALFSYLGVRAANAAKSEAAETRTENTADHGRVAQALRDLVSEFREHRVTTNHRFDELGQSIGAVREAHMRHLEHHVEHPHKED